MITKRIFILSLCLVSSATNIWCMDDVVEKATHEDMRDLLKNDTYLRNMLNENLHWVGTGADADRDAIRLQLNPENLLMYHTRIISHPATLQCPETGDRGHTCQQNVCDANTFKNCIVPEVGNLYKDYMQVDRASIKKRHSIARLGIASTILGLCTAYNACTTKSCALAGISGGLFSVAGLTYYNTRKMCKADPFLTQRYQAMTAVNKTKLFKDCA